MWVIWALASDGLREPGVEPFVFESIWMEQEGYLRGVWRGQERIAF